MKKLGTLEEIKELRTVWSHEALDFTPWLADEENISILSEAVGIDIAVDERESSVGDFNVDILASEIGTGRKINSKIPTTTTWENLLHTPPASLRK